jgi:plastocyanin
LQRPLVMLAAPVLILATAAWHSRDALSPRAGQVVIVREVEVSATAYRFEPAEVTVLPGDTVRFFQTSNMPHNVQFTKTPPGSKLGAAKVGPYLAAVNQTYDVVIDARFPSGQYRYMCTPHVSLGMKGTISVAVPQ